MNLGKIHYCFTIRDFIFCVASHLGMTPCWFQKTLLLKIIAKKQEKRSFSLNTIHLERACGGFPQHESQAANQKDELFDFTSAVLARSWQSLEKLSGRAK